MVDRRMEAIVMKCVVCAYLIGALGALGMIAGGPAAWAGAPVAIYTFQGGADGDQPFGNLVADPAGNLYGVTTGGGTHPQAGTVFELTPPATQSGSWTETVLYNFTGAADGGNPEAGLVRDAAGNIYGTTLIGGCLPSCGSSYGTVFELTPPAAGQNTWVFTTIHRFNPTHATPDGALPKARLILDIAGNLYGTTESGGLFVSGYGVVFKLTPPTSGSDPWSETLLHVFSGYSEGVHPRAGVTFDGAGNLYGTTLEGGLFGRCCGTVFQLSPSKSGVWTDTVLQRFNDKNGLYPQSDLVFDAAGNLYGAVTNGQGNGSICPQGCGGVFELSPPPGGVGSWGEQTIYRFPGTSLAASPLAVFYQNGTLYGAAVEGGSQSLGAMFALTPSGKKFWNIATDFFAGSAGAGPMSLVIDPAVSGATTFYGVADHGGSAGFGTVFSWTP